MFTLMAIGTFPRTQKSSVSNDRTACASLVCLADDFGRCIIPKGDPRLKFKPNNTPHLPLDIPLHIVDQYDLAVYIQNS